MPAPTPLAIITSAVQRLLKEEASYHQELAEQEKTVKKLDEKLEAMSDDKKDGNEEFMLKQLHTAIEQTKAMFGPMRLRIADAVSKLEDQLAAAEAGDAGGSPLDTEISQAKSVLAQAKKAAAAA